MSPPDSNDLLLEKCTRLHTQAQVCFADLGTQSQAALHADDRDLNSARMH
jgi:hypothetical protein